MPWMRLNFTPGINKDLTRYSADGTWYDGSLVRFRNGQPEMWSGWVRLSELEMEGICRSLHRFSSLEGFPWVGIGTSRRFYMLSDDLNYDVTPIEETASLANNPLDFTSGSNVVVVNDTAHGHFPGDVIIISGAATAAGIDSSELNAEHTISAYIDEDSYEIEITNDATSTTSGGGASVVVSYLYHAGTDSVIEGGGWGSLTWGEEEWGGDPTLGVQDKIGYWSQDNWGEDLVACANKGPIFYWDRTNPSDRMVDILDLAGADGNAPQQAEFILVSHRDRHLLAFGGTAFGGSTVEPMTVRWCSQEDITDWDEASTTGTAGSIPLSNGSRLLAACATNREILVWSDSALYSMQYQGAPFIYGVELVEELSDVAGQNAVCTASNVVFWMGRTGFYAYTGTVEPIPCTVWDYVSSRLDWSQAIKICAGTNKRHNEIIWFYPSVDSIVDGISENDSYVAFNAVDKVWTVGELTRTAWLEMDPLNNPIAASSDNYLYEHENGAEDGSTEPASALEAYIESAPIELSSEGAFDKGDRFMFIRRILPDVTFRGYSDGVNTPQMNLILKMMDKPGGAFDTSSSSQVSRSAIIPVEEFTDDVHVRLRGRAMALRAESSTKGTQWRLGTPRIDVRTDGKR